MHVILCCCSWSNYIEKTVLVLLLQKIVIISISLKSCQHFTEPNEKKGAEEKEELTFLLLLMCTTKVVEIVIGCNLYLKILTSLLVVECGYGYFGWCFWLKLSVFVCMLLICWRQLRVRRSIHSCIIGYNICQSLCSSIKRHLLDPLLFPTYNPVTSPYSEMLFVVKEFTSHYLLGVLKRPT